MSKLEKFIRSTIEAEYLGSVQRILNRCIQEIEDSGMGELSEYILYDVIDDELNQIDEEKERKFA